jgi:hypothetical protein
MEQLIPYNNNSNSNSNSNNNNNNNGSDNSRQPMVELNQIKDIS